MLASSRHRAIEPPSRQSIKPASSHSIEPASSFQHRTSRPGLRHVRVHNIGKHGSRWHRSHPHPDTLQQLRTEMANAVPSTTTIPNKPGTIGKFSVHRWAWRQKSSARSEDSSIAVLMKLGSGCQHCRRTMGGRRDGCCTAVAMCSTRSGCLRRGAGPWGW
jgi:hypothetical protein